MTKAQQHSIERIRQAAKLIEELIPKERQRESWQRRKALGKAYQAIWIHAPKLDLEAPQLTVFYDPNDYLTKTQPVLAQLNKQGEEPLSSQRSHHQ